MCHGRFKSVSVGRVVNISLITPAGKQSQSGNRTTAVRWQRLLRALGHRVAVATDYDGAPADLMIAIHAWRSAGAIMDFRERFPKRPLIVALGGTDINTFQKTHPETTLKSMAIADALVGLHDRVCDAIPKRFCKKLHVIHQSAQPLTQRRAPAKRWFEVCVIGHLREEKDPLRTAEAAAMLPATSRLRVIHLGKAHDKAWAAAARREMRRNPRYLWRDEVPGWAVRREFARAHLMVLSSVQEGGANVIGEAIVAGVPVIASEIDGSVGLLGPNYQGYFPTGDTRALADRLARAETDRDYLRTLARQCRARAKLFRPAREKRAWRQLLAEVTH